MPDLVLPPDPVLADGTDRALDRYREIRDRWAGSPRMRVPLGTARQVAAVLEAEFPGQHAGRVVAAMAKALASARKLAADRDGMRLDALWLLNLAAVAAAELEDAEAGHG